MGNELNSRIDIVNNDDELLITNYNNLFHKYCKCIQNDEEQFVFFSVMSFI